MQASSFMAIRGDKLWVGLFDDEDPGKAYRYSLGSELHVLFESGSAEYPDAKTRERTIHHGPLAKLGGP